MDSEAISAFAAFSQKKAKSVEKRSKSKERKKAKLGDGSVTPVLKIKTEPPESYSPMISEAKIKKEVDSGELIKTILEAQRESIFKGCAVTNKVDNMFLNDKNSGSEVEGKKKTQKRKENMPKPKKSKKIKLMNGDAENCIKNSQKGSGHPSNVNGDTNSKIGAQENGVPHSDKSSKGAKKNSNEVNKAKKLQKKKIKNNKLKFLIKKKKAATSSKHVEVNNQEQKKSNKKSKPKEGDKKPKFPEIIKADSTKVGEELLSWILSPLSLTEFFEHCWEQKPVHIQHSDKDYFTQLCTLDKLKHLLRVDNLYFTKNIDITSYIDGERRTENPGGKAKLSQVWDFYRNGRSVRLLNPQTFIRNIWILNSTLQEFFHCFVGANIYLTPPGTQGFAPHYDDIEAFVLQLEGEKHWKLYNPRTPEEMLPRESSRNFREDEIGNPILEVTLRPGDVLYFPRGFIHQAKSAAHIHSLHVTISCYQKNSWADLLEKVIPVAIQQAISKNVEFRKGLPIGYSNCLGLVHSDRFSHYRAEMKRKFDQLVRKLLEYCPLDAGVDQLAAGYIHDALPPCLTLAEELHGGDRNCKLENENFLDILKNSSGKKLRVKLIRSTCVRLVSEEENMYLYYTTENSLVYHEHEVSSVWISSQWAQGLEFLILTYPNFVQMKLLPVSLEMNKPGKWRHIVEFIYFLWQKGLVLFDQPLREICA